MRSRDILAAPRPLPGLTAVLALAVLLALAASMTASLAAAQSAPHERLHIVPPPGWKIGVHDRRNGVDVTKLIPPDETLSTWTQMLTVRLIDEKPEQSAADFLKDQVVETRRACEDFGTGPVGPRDENGYETGLQAIVCTKSKQTGQGEMHLFKAIRGQNHLYVVSRAWRGDPFDKAHIPVSSDTTKGWIRFMDAVIACDPGDERHPCPQPPSITPPQ